MLDVLLVVNGIFGALGLAGVRKSNKSRVKSPIAKCGVLFCTPRGAWWSSSLSSSLLLSLLLLSFVLVRAVYAVVLRAKRSSVVSNNPLSELTSDN